MRAGSNPRVARCHWQSNARAHLSNVLRPGRDSEDVAPRALPRGRSAMAPDSERHADARQGQAQREEEVLVAMPQGSDARVAGPPELYGQVPDLRGKEGDLF